MLYSVVVFWPLIVKYIYNRSLVRIGKRPIGKSWFILLAVIPMLSLIAFRSSSMGADTGQYLMNFIDVRDGSFETILDNSRMEDGYLYFVKMVTYITKSPEVFQVIYSSIYAISLIILMKEFEDICFDFLFFYGTLGLYTFMFTGVRQCLAMSMCIIAYKFAVSRKIIWFILFVFLAFNLHRSAILFVVVYFVVRWKIRWYSALVYIIGTYLAIRYIGQIQDFFNEAWDMSYGIEETGNGVIFFLYVLILVSVSIFIMYNTGSMEKNRALINLSIITVIFWTLRLFTRVAERPSYYYLFFVCALVPYAINFVKGKDKIICELLICGTAYLLFVYRLGTNFSSLVPYQSFWRY